MMVVNIIILLLLISSLLSYGKKSLVLGCGLIGFNGAGEFDPDKIKMLMLANITRGKHSTGIYNDKKITKKAMDAIDFLASERLHPEKIFIGHDRFATVGLKNSDNAHPFEYNGVILAHNGTLTNHWQLTRDYQMSYNDYDVDSQVLAYLVSKQKDSYKVLSEFEGAAALIWTDRDDPNRIYCFRNSERPLFFGYVDRDMYISSIENSLKIIGCTKIRSFKTDYVYSIVNGTISVQDSKRIIRKKKSFKNFNKKGYNNNKNTFKKKEVDSFDSSWVKCQTALYQNELVIGNWYKISVMSSGYYISIINKNNDIRSYPKTMFSPVDDLVAGAFVEAMETSVNKLIKAGEKFVINEVKEEDGNLEMVEITNIDTDKVFTWVADAFRIMSEAEVMLYYNAVNKLDLKKDKELYNGKTIKEEPEFNVATDPIKTIANLYAEMNDIGISIDDISDKLDILSSLLVDDTSIDYYMSDAVFACEQLGERVGSTVDKLQKYIDENNINE